LHRQADIFRRQGVELSRQTMLRLDARLRRSRQPLYELMKHRVLGSKAVQTDDTPVPVLDPALHAPARAGSGPMWEMTNILHGFMTTRPRAAVMGRKRSWKSSGISPGRRLLRYDHFYKERNAESPRSHVGRIQGGAFLKRSLRT